MRFADVGRLCLICVAAGVTALGATACNPLSSSRAAQSTSKPTQPTSTAAQVSNAAQPATPTASTPTASTSNGARSTSCGGNGTTIPAGTYAGPIKATLTTQMRINLPGASIPNAGGGTEVFNGDVKVVSDGKQVTGTITLSGLGLSQVGLPGAVNVHSVDNGGLAGTISGSASSPVVDGKLSGEWASLDAPVINATGSADSPIHAGLHITRAGCDSISGDAIAMFTEFASSVSQYLTFGGSGVWTAMRAGATAG